MSFKLVESAFDAPVADPQAKLVLLAIARHADKRGSCYPSAARLMVVTGLSKASVYRKISYLEKHGFIRVTRRGKDGKKTSNLYRLLLSQSETKQSHSETKVSLCEPLTSHEPVNNISCNVYDSQGDNETKQDPFLDLAKKALKGKK
jgi:DNA-binding PadR family transcriptional regulator